MGFCFQSEDILNVTRKMDMVSSIEKIGTRQLQHMESSSKGSVIEETPLGVCYW